MRPIYKIRSDQNVSHLPLQAKPMIQNVPYFSLLVETKKLPRCPSIDFRKWALTILVHGFGL